MSDSLQEIRAMLDKSIDLAIRSGGDNKAQVRLELQNTRGYWDTLCQRNFPLTRTMVLQYYDTQIEARGYK